jgi:PAS domain S-box-containing protein
LLGYAPEELLRLTFRDVAVPFHEKAVAPAGEALDAEARPARLDDAPATRTAQLRARDGRVLTVELRSAQVEDAQGRTLAMSVLRDLGAFPQLDYLALLHMAPDAVLATGDGHRIIFWSKGAEATYGWTQEEALGRVPRELLKTRDHAPQVRASVGDTLEAEGAWEGEVTHTCKDGREIRVASRWLVHRDAQGRPRGILGINRDITEQRSAREQLQRLQQLEGVNRLVAGLAHHFNNHLAVILSGAEGLRLALPAGPTEPQDIVGDILAAGTAAKELLVRLAQLGRAGSETSEPIDLNEVVRRCERTLRKSLPEGVELVVELADSLWPVVCEPLGVGRALLNLALNARDAMPRGGRLTLASANVEVDPELVRAHPFLRRGPHVRLTVADTGCGMTPEVKAHAFEPFFTTKPLGQGLGLGLATAYGLVKQNSGYVTLESECGRGTTVGVYFPRA